MSSLAIHSIHPYSSIYQSPAQSARAKKASFLHENKMHVLYLTFVRDLKFSLPGLYAEMQSQYALPL